MRLRLRAGEPLSRGLARLAAEEIEWARDALLAGDDPAAGVHEARKSLKKVRAVLHLSRSSLGRKRFRAANRHCRDLARRLAEQRDARVRVATLDALLAGMDGRASTRMRGASRRRLVPRARRHDDAAVRREIAAALAEAGSGIGRLLARRGPEVARPGLARTYRQGRRQMRAARREPTAAAFHAWRKRVKFLWYQVRLVRPAWPETLGTLADELHRLSDHLGKAHDYDLLEAGLREEADRDPLFDPAPLLASLGEARALERAAALDLGRRIYAEDPDDFAARIEAYRRAWRGAGVGVR